EAMSAPVYTLPATAELSEAAAQLDRAKVSGLSIIDDQGHPIGIFTKTEALRSREKPSTTKVEAVMSYGMLIVSARTPVFRAAAQAYETQVRRVLVMD